jgi:hypothetical protein
MLDDLRNTSNPFYPEDQDENSEPSEKSPAYQERPKESFQVVDRESGEEGLFLGMTAAQRFIIVLLLFMMVCVMGTFCLIFTERVALPF